MLATMTVSVFHDNVDPFGNPLTDDGDLTLRDAIAYVNRDATPLAGDLIHFETDPEGNLLEPFGVNDTILFDSSLDGGTINLEHVDNPISRYALEITESVIIDASMLTSLTINASMTDPTPGPDPTLFDGQGNSVFGIVLDTGSGQDESVTLKALTITGGDAPIHGGGVSFKPFTFDENRIATLSIVDSVIEANHAKDNGGGVYAKDTWAGGTADLNIFDSIIRNNKASGQLHLAAKNGGGGVYIEDIVTTTITGTLFLENNANTKGGGLLTYIRSFFIAGEFVDGTVTIVDSLFKGNKAEGLLPVNGEEGGGGIHATFAGDRADPTTATLNLVNSTVVDNEATDGDGGGVWICSKDGGTFNATNSTISGNRAPNGDGGGLWIAIVDENSDRMITNLNHVTITDNDAVDGGGLYNQDVANVVTTLYQTIVSDNHTAIGGAANNVAGDIENDSSYNLFGTSDPGAVPPGNGNILNVNDPGLDPLADNGGFLLPDGSTILTHAVKSSSPALDAGDPDAVQGINVPQFDQRGVGPEPFFQPFKRVVDIDEINPNGDGIIDIGAFELQSLIPCVLGADFDVDGDVDGDDFLIWQTGFGITSGATHGDGDADCDGDVDGDDFLIWQNQFGTGENVFDRGDFDEDGDVDGDDFLIWQANFPTTSGAQHGDGDGDADGDVDGNDFLIWQTGFSFGGGGGSGSGPTVDFVNAVQVTDVIISGSTSTHAPFSMSTVDGSGTQLATVPVGGADTISIVFSEHANVTASDLDIVGLYTANEPNLVVFSYDVYTQTATWQFDGWSLGDQYAITLADSVTDVTNAPAGNTLDGEWTNPAHITTVNAAVSEFPSGDGTAGGDFTFVMTLLPGDANLDNKVDGADYMIWQANNGAIEALFGDADFDGDGVVDGNDFLLWQQNTGANLEALWILADLDGDYDVDYDDLMIMIYNINGTNPTWAQGDLNGDGVIDVNDFWLWMGQNGLDIDVVA